MNNHMFIQCYDLNIDRDVAMNYVMYIPDGEAYADPFYDLTATLNPKLILKEYSVGKKILDTRRKEIKAKPKEAVTEMTFREINGHAELKFMYYLSSELITTCTCPIGYPVDIADPSIENCEETFTKLLSRIKRGGACFVYDGLRMDLIDKIMECSSIYYYTVKYRGRNIRIPMTRSMFFGIKNPEKFYFSVQETNISPDIYVYSYSLTKKGITEQLFGYTMAF